MTNRRGIGAFVAGVIALSLLFGAVYVLFVRTYTGQVIDARAFDGAAEQHDLVHWAAVKLLEHVPELAIGGGAVLILLVGGVTRRFKHVAVALGAAATALSVTELAKHVVLTRTDTGATDFFHNSLPSGHATVAAAAAFAVFLVSTPRWRPVAALVGGAFAVSVGVLLVIGQWHRPSDVIAAFLVVAICGCLSGIVLLLWRVPEADPSASPLNALWWVFGASAVVAIMALGVVFVTATDERTPLQIAYLGGSAAILAAGSGLAAAGNRWFRRLS
ncbi:MULTISPECIES: phosphatase PAP2 family protein [Bacteria]|uniref:phosphatase PAP2 family protein n=1 Tax=Bacteria TaxID=2 RepID=UPI003C7DFEB9